MSEIENINWKEFSEVMTKVFNDVTEAFNNFAKAISEINRKSEQEEMTKKCLTRALYQEYTGGINETVRR